MAFDYAKWVTEGAKPEDLPADERAKLKTAWEPTEDPAVAMRKSLFGDDPAAHSSESGGLSADDVKSMIHKEQNKALFENQLAGVRKDIGEDAFAKSFEAARPYMEKGLSPTEAFNYVRQPELTAAAIEVGKAEAVKQARLEARRSEANHRPQRGFVPPTDTTDNPWAQDKDKYKTQRDSLLRLDAPDEMAWRRDNPDFAMAEKIHGDVKVIERR